SSSSLQYLTEYLVKEWPEILGGMGGITLKAYRKPDEKHLLGDLVEKAESQGYLTMEDIMEAFAEDDSPEQIEEMYLMLHNAGIEIYDDKNDTPEEGHFDDLEEEEEEAFDLSSVSSDDTVGLYLKEMARVPLLTTEEEVALAKRLEKGLAAQADINCGKTTDSDCIRALVLCVEDGKDARDHLIKANTRLVVSIAKRYMGRGVPFLDLIQEGNLGLMKAVEKFDYTRGY